MKAVYWFICGFMICGLIWATYDYTHEPKSPKPKNLSVWVEVVDYYEDMPGRWVYVLKNGQKVVLPRTANGDFLIKEIQ